jgi:ribosomal protein S18 acetylase RimI-like enzyme
MEAVALERGAATSLPGSHEARVVGYRRPRFREKGRGLPSLSDNLRRVRYDDLKSVSLTELHATFLEAFSDYFVPLRPSLADFEEMMRRRGFDPAASVGVFEEERLVAFTCNGVGQWNDERAGYDTGTGVIPSMRRRGAGEQMMERSVEALRGGGNALYVLEVLEPNQGAFTLYQRSGFEVSRMLQCFSYDAAQESATTASSNVAAEERDPEFLTAWFDREPSWQNSLASVRRSSAPRVTLVARHEGEVVGGAVLFPGNGDIAFLSVDPAWRRRGFGSAILREARNHAGRPLRLVNIDDSCSSALAFLDATGAQRTVRQYEMIRAL